MGILPAPGQFWTLLEDVLRDHTHGKRLFSRFSAAKGCIWVAKHGQLFRQLGCKCCAHLSVLLSIDCLACCPAVASIIATVAWQGTHVHFVAGNLLCCVADAQSLFLRPARFLLLMLDSAGAIMLLAFK